MTAPVSLWYSLQSPPNPPHPLSNPPQKLGYGTGTAWYKTGDESQLDQTCIDSAKTAIGLEYHHLDGAEVYKTETELGTAIKQSGVAREKLYIVTKVLPNIADIPAALNTSLKKLGVDYVDL
jgi:diketogulonate reductase-like aldo/keto reductase